MYLMLAAFWFEIYIVPQRTARNVMPGHYTSSFNTHRKLYDNFNNGNMISWKFKNVEVGEGLGQNM